MRLAVGQTGTGTGADVASLDWEAIGRLVRDRAREAAVVDLVLGTVVWGSASADDAPGPAKSAT
jgi:hypothetical protein